MVPKVARVHFLNLKVLICILIYTGSTWDIGTKCMYVIPQGFWSQMCSLTIPTICTFDTVTKGVGKSSSGMTAAPSMDRFSSPIILGDYRNWYIIHGLDPDLYQNKHRINPE